MVDKRASKDYVEPCEREAVIIESQSVTHLLLALGGVPVPSYIILSRGFIFTLSGLSQ
jgi:hypothetical protein